MTGGQWVAWVLFGVIYPLFATFLYAILKDEL